MELLTKEIVQELLAVNQAPCISLYMPTHRSHPEKLQDVIRFKNLIKELEASLSKKYAADEVKKNLEPFEAIVNDTKIWNQTSDGLAILTAQGIFKVIKLQESVKELAMVADSFHTKPLRQYLQSTDRYHVLGIGLKDIQLFEGNRHSLVKLDLQADVPETIIQALGDELTEKHSSIDSAGIHFGQGGKKDEEDNDTERFFRAVSKSIYENYSKPTGLPLILAALPNHRNLFQKVNKNPLLLADGIDINPESVAIDKLAEMAWSIMEPEYIGKLDSLVEKFAQEKANGKGSDDMKEIGVAAVAGKIDTLIIEADRMIPNKLTNLVTGNIQNRDLTNPKVDDLLDDLGELVLKMGGHVMVLPAEKMPSESGLAAIFRY
ncbi:MAG: baeRF3 domain-containing protein [Lutibacter sp.]